MGFGVEPDPTYGGKVPNLSGTVCIFRQEWQPETKLSSGFRTCAASLPFAVMVSSTDGVDATELDVISRRFSGLSVSERNRLEARLRVLLQHPPAVRSLRSAVTGLSAAQRKGIGQFLLLVAAADGRITHEEVKALQKTYSVLELPPESVHSELHELIAGGSGASGKKPVTVRQARSASLAYELPPKSVNEGGVILLDEVSIRRKREESESVVALLEEVFSDEVPQVEVELADGDEEDEEDNVFDDAHSRLVQELLRYGQIPAERWGEMCREVNLLPDAAIETINEAVVDRFEDVLIEKADPLRVDTEIAGLVRGIYE